MSTINPKRKAPEPLFENLEFIEEQPVPSHIASKFHQDFEACREFLLAYKGSYATFHTYRREVERLMQWLWLIADLNLIEVKRKHVEQFIEFCRVPPRAWIGTKRARKFGNENGERVANPKWRPFVATVTKAERKQGIEPDKTGFELSGKSIEEMMRMISAFFGFLVLEETIPTNPVALIRQKNRFYQRKQGLPKIRRLSTLQWNTVFEVAQELAEENPIRYERTLFMISMLYSLYLRISELTARPTWTPTMNDFARDDEGNWWLTVVGKGNKMRRIAVSDAMMRALKRWRKHLGFSGYPSPADDSPLLPKAKGSGALADVSGIRAEVQRCFDKAAEKLSLQGLEEEADNLAVATVHWLRHTGISDDVKRRPREHVRDDAGHSSGAITDKYIDVELRERHKSAKGKTMLPNV